MPAPTTISPETMSIRGCRARGQERCRTSHLCHEAPPRPKARRQDSGEGLDLAAHSCAEHQAADEAYAAAGFGILNPARISMLRQRIDTRGCNAGPSARGTGIRELT